MNKPQKNKRPQTATRRLSFFNSVQNCEGLNFMTIDKTESLKIKLVNNGWSSFQTQKAESTASRARIIIDFTKTVGNLVFTEPPRRVPGFSLSVSEDNLIYTFEQTAPYWNWFTNDQIVLLFPAVKATGQNGCGFVEARIENVEGTYTATSTTALFILDKNGEVCDIAATWRYDNSVYISGQANDEGAGVMKLAITNSIGFLQTGQNGSNTSFYFQLSDGYSRDFNALMPPEMAQLMRVEISEAYNWKVKKFGNADYPVWKITYASAKGGSPAEVLLKLIHIKSLEQSARDTQCILYYLDIPGMADGYQILNIPVRQATEDQINAGAGLSIDSFTANATTLNNINGPAQVLLSWSTTNAAYVTLSGLGIVDATVTDQDVYIEQTTTFVLTAFSASLAGAVSKAVTVTVTPDLLSRVIPKGTILIWSGSAETIPANWSLCDGTNGTPDLRDKFIVGAGNNYTPNSSGSANTHTHAINVADTEFTSTSDGNHTHAMPSNWYARNLSCGVHTGIDTNGHFDANNTHTQEAGVHNHTVKVVIPSFNSDNNDNPPLPPWYALCYIMKQGV